MDTGELADWIAETLPDGHQYENAPTKTFECLAAAEIPHWEYDAIASSLLLDCLTEVGCEFRLEGANSDGYHMIKVMPENSRSWDIIKHGKTRYDACRKAVEVIAERKRG